jgi:calcineurin-like phosphoesterase
MSSQTRKKNSQAQVGLLKEEYAADFVIVNCKNASAEAV